MPLMIWASVLQGAVPEGSGTAPARGASPAAPVPGDGARDDGADVPAAEAPSEEAFAALYGEVATPLATYVRRTLGSTEEAHDVVQEVFYRYLRAGLPAGTDPAAARPYLYRSATHLLRDRWRRAKRDRSWRETLAPVAVRRRTSGAADPDRTLSSDLERALRRLKPRDRALLWLAHVEGASHREIAHTLDLAEASVRVLLFRARRKMEKMLEATGFPTEDWK